MHASNASIDTAEQELVLTRVFAAPRELVFEAWTDPEHLARWFGPRDSTLPFCKMDVRPGGVLHFCRRSSSPPRRRSRSQSSAGWPGRAGPNPSSGSSSS